jgi:hypothetical protein
VIDRLHLRNHVDKKCQKLYNPDDKLPKNFNTMACEQTFIWASIQRNVTAIAKHPFSPNWEKLPFIKLTEGSSLS